MKTSLVKIIGVVLLGVTTMAANAAPSDMQHTTGLICGGGDANCSLLNAGGTTITVLAVHAEDGQGNVLAAQKISGF